MDLIIQNADEKLYKAIKSLIDLCPNARVKIDRKQNLAKKLNKESNELIEQYKAGKIKAYDTAEEMAKAINGEI